MNGKSQTTYENWEVLSRLPLKEYKSQTTHLRHKSGFEVFHVANENPENLFAFAFKTLPQDNTGVAHILEHTVLCGSLNYPVKDPFLNLIKSSLNTFLNAFTFPDKTVYAASSCVEKDFFNLMRVYADAVFHPRLEKSAFHQEGWHFKQTKEGKLDISGIVYNEMKGVYSSAESLMQEASVHSLFEKSVYRFDSGGNPDSIPDLTYEDFVAFHHAHYHPSQTRLFLFGNLPLETHLAFLEKEVLAKTVPFSANPLPALLKEPRWEKPRFETLRVPPSEDSHLPSVLINWLTCDISEPEDVLGMEILSQILLLDASPLVLKLLEEGYGEDISPLSGYESELRDTLFSLGMRGVREDKVGSFYPAVWDILKEMSQKGLEKELVEGVLFSFDFSLREIKGSGQGLRLMRRTLRGWMHGREPMESLIFQELLSSVKEKWAKGRYFEDLIERYLLNNPHHTCLTFIPDAEYEGKHRQTFESWLLKKETELLPSRKGELALLEEELKKFQETPDSPEALASLPMLAKEDLPRIVRPSLPFETSSFNPSITGVEARTNGIVYVNFYFSLNHIDPALFPYLGLLHRAWDSLGSKDLVQEELDKELRLTFGNFYFGLHHEESVTGDVKPWLSLTFATTPEKKERAFWVADQVLNSPNFENEKRLRELLLELKNDFGSSLTYHGNQYAELSALAELQTLYALKESVSGLSAYRFWLEKTKNLDTAVQDLKQSFSHLRDLIVNQNTVKVFVVSEDTAIKQAWQQEVVSLLSTMSNKPSPAQTIPPPVAEANAKAILIKTKVSFNAQAFVGVPSIHLDYPVVVFISHFLKSHHLWNKIRMQGGAYGAGATAYASGLFSFSSYRDPHTQKTFKAFRESLSEIAQTPLSQGEIDSTLIGMLGSDLAPISPNAHAILSFKFKERGATEEIRQRIRDGYFTIDPDSLTRVATLLLKNQEKAKNVSLTSEALITAEPLEGSVQKISLQGENP